MKIILRFHSCISSLIQAATLVASLLLLLTGARVSAGITVTQNLGPGATNWPGLPLLSTTGNPGTQSTVAESFSGATSVGQTFTLPAGSNYTLETITLYVGGGTGTSGPAPVTVNLYDLGAVAAPNPNSYSLNANLLGSGNGIALTYTAQAAGLLRLDFTGPDQVTLGAGRMYVFELAGTSGTTPMPWYRTTADTYAGGAAYRDRTWINGTSARDFSLAVYGTVTTNQPAPADCTVEAASARQRMDGFGAGVAFLYVPPQVPVNQDPLPETQMDQLFGTAGTQFGLTLIRLRISPDGNHADNITDGQRAKARGVRILATPWTPPAAMKDNGSLIRGSLLPAKYGDYVTFLNNYLAQMAASGAPVDVISLQNEPDWDPDYEGCVWTSEQFRTFCRDFAGGLTAPVMLPESLNFNPTYSDPTLNDPAAVANVDYVGGHLYGATVRDYPLARAKGLPIWMTEYLENDQSIGSAVTTARQISDCLTVGNMSAYIWWKCIGDANGLLNNAAQPQRRGYVMAQFSRFIRPGDYRVAVPANTGPLGISAFKDAPSGRFALIAVNTTTLPVTQNFNLQGITLATVTPYITSATQSLETQTPVTISNSAFTYTIPATSVVTFAGNAAVAPTISTQPISQSIVAGSSVTFTVAASGGPAPTYQWHKDGVAIPGATTSNLTINGVTGSDSADYTVVATNSSGSAASNPASLLVIQSPTNAIITITVE
jgi:glucuronoarabinoxylan endo-1,4-beta-xylanase